jgi:hypothetical protein
LIENITPAHNGFLCNGCWHSLPPIGSSIKTLTSVKDRLRADFLKQVSWKYMGNRKDRIDTLAATLFRACGLPGMQLPSVTVGNPRFSDYSPHDPYQTDPGTSRDNYISSVPLCPIQTRRSP